MKATLPWLGGWTTARFPSWLPLGGDWMPNDSQDLASWLRSPHLAPRGEHPSAKW